MNPTFQTNLSEMLEMRILTDVVLAGFWSDFGQREKDIYVSTVWLNPWLYIQMVYRNILYTYCKYYFLQYISLTEHVECNLYCRMPARLGLQQPINAWL